MLNGSKNMYYEYLQAFIFKHNKVEEIWLSS